MRETFGTLLQVCKDYTIDPSKTSSTNISNTEKFLKSEINKTVRYMFSRIRNYKSQLLPQTMTTVADQIFYHYPPGIDSIETITMTVGDLSYPLFPISSQYEWDRLKIIEFAADTIPKYYFPRKYDFGIYPTPQDAYTVTLVANNMPKDMSVADYITGTVATTQNSQTVTGTTTVFTAAMVGRWFASADSSAFVNGNWYRISAFSSSTSITLQSVFEDTALSGSSYVIGESPEIPVELHELIPYRVAAAYFQTYRRDPRKAQTFMNFFYTGDFGNPERSGDIHGGLLGAINRYDTYGRANKQTVQMGRRRFVYGDRFWATTLTSA